MPRVAIRGAVINAVVHADYAQRGATTYVSIFDERLGIESPGLLLFGLTVQDLWHGISRLRNRVIGRAFPALGINEQRGSGIQQMMAACRHAGLADPLLGKIATWFRVTIITQPVSRHRLDKTDQGILDALSDQGGRLTSEISSLIGLTSGATRMRLVRLVRTGSLCEVGCGPQDPKRRYFGANLRR